MVLIPFKELQAAAAVRLAFHQEQCASSYILISSAVHYIDQCIKIFLPNASEVC